MARSYDAWRGRVTHGVAHVHVAGHVHVMGSNLTLSHEKQGMRLGVIATFAVHAINSADVSVHFRRETLFQFKSIYILIH